MKYSLSMNHGRISAEEDSSREVFAKRKHGALEEAYLMAIRLMNSPRRTEWDVKAFAWCLIDLIKRDVRLKNRENLSHYLQQLKSLDIDPNDEILKKQAHYVLKLCNPSNSLMISSKEVFAKRKEGALDEAYQMGIRLMSSPERDEWDIKAFAWCLIDLIKRDDKSGYRQNLSNYSEQLNSLEVNFEDDVLKKQIEYALGLCSSDRPLILQAKKLCKEGRYHDAVNTYRKIMNRSNCSAEIQTGLAWTLYYFSKVLLEQEHPNTDAIKRHLHEYCRLDATEKPSTLHSCFLRIADKLAREGKLHMATFVKQWGLQNLRADDYTPFKSDDGKLYPSLAERVVLDASKDVWVNNALNDIDYILPYVDSCITKYPDNLWLKLNKARLLMLKDKHKEALPLAIDIVKNKSGDYWVWELLGDIYKPSAQQSALCCYCKALQCSKEINFVYKVKVKLARLLIDEREYSRAKCELEEVINYRTDHEQKIPESVESLVAEPWYESVIVKSSNLDFYAVNASKVSLLLYADIPWTDANVGECFSLESNLNKKKRKLYIKSSPVPIEIIIPESKFQIRGIKTGMGIKIKGEYNGEKRYQVYAVEKRDNCEKWDIFNEHIGIVDHINTQKKLLHFLVDQKINGVIKFSDLKDHFNEGDAIAVRALKSATNKGIFYKALTAHKTKQHIPDSICKKFESIVEKVDAMGFTEDDIFIPPNLMKNLTIEDGSNVKGTAILSYDKRRMRWSWKAINVEKVATD